MPIFTKSFLFFQEKMKYRSAVRNWMKTCPLACRSHKSAGTSRFLRPDWFHTSFLITKNMTKKISKVRWELSQLKGVASISLGWKTGAVHIIQNRTLYFILKIVPCFPEFTKSIEDLSLTVDHERILRNLHGYSYSWSRKSSGGDPTLGNFLEEYSNCSSCSSFHFTKKEDLKSRKSEYRLT